MFPELPYIFLVCNYHRLRNNFKLLKNNTSKIKKSSMIFRKERYYFKLFMIKMCKINNGEVIERAN